MYSAHDLPRVITHSLLLVIFQLKTTKSTSESLFGDPGELFLCRDISSVRSTNEVSLHKNNEPDLQTRIHHELVLVFMLYYFCFIDINV